MSLLSGRYAHCAAAVYLFDICLVFSRAVCGPRAALDPGVALRGGGLEVVWGFKSAGTHCDATCGFFVKQDVAGSRSREAAVIRVYPQTDEEEVCAVHLLARKSDSTLLRLGRLVRTNRNIKHTLAVQQVEPSIKLSRLAKRLRLLCRLFAR